MSEAAPSPEALALPGPLAGRRHARLGEPVHRGRRFRHLARPVVEGARRDPGRHQAVDPFLRGQFSAYRIDPLRIRSLNPAVAVAHAAWRWHRFRETPEAPAEDRAGLVTMVLSLADGWLISACHNTRTD